MECRIAGIGAWGPGFDGWAGLSEHLRVAAAEPLPATAPPKPDRIPPRERRRSPLPVKLAVEVAGQACQAAGLDPSTTACVFGSGMGDMDITDYMCRALDSEDRLLSPTRFHNSVHNAAAGYWSISTECRAPANSVCAFRHTFPMALLEAATQCQVEQRPVLLVVQDIAAPEPFKDILPVPDAFGVALALVPDQPNTFLQLSPDTADWPDLDCPALVTLYRDNPAARSLAMLTVWARGGGSVRYPLAATGTMNVELDP